jgi:hypothetical protein
MNLFKIYRETVIYRTWFYLLLMFAVVCDLVRPELQGVRFFASAGIEDQYGCQLDSFAEPSIAAAVFKHEAERSFSAYVRTRDLEATSLAYLADSAWRGTGQASAIQPGSLANRPGRAAGLAATQSLMQLRSKVVEAKVDVDRTLLSIYSDTGLWTKFLDHYLGCLHETPENSLVVNWVTCALVHSHDCGRTSEVVEAVRQAIRVNRDANAARLLGDNLELWRMGNPLRPEAPNP